MTENEMIWALWDVLGDFPTCRGDLLGEDLYHEINSYLNPEEYEDDDDFIDSDIEVDNDSTN